LGVFIGRLAAATAAAGENVVSPGLLLRSKYVRLGRLLTTPDRPTLLNWSAVRELGSVGRVHFAFRGHQLPPEKEPSMRRVWSCVIADTL
jgi:hypothetical protein